MDTKREKLNISAEMRRREQEFRITILWYRLDSEEYERDELYDVPALGGKVFKAAVTMPAFWLVDEDDPELMLPEGRDPQKVIRIGMRADTFLRRGMSVEPQDRHGDRFRYEGQVYEVDAFGSHGHAGEPESETSVAIIGTRLQPGDTPYETESEAVP
jgi:hypothetical protein